MKKAIKLLVVVLVAIIIPMVVHASPTPFFEAQSGIMGSNASVARTYGVRGGIITNRHEFSLGYWSAVGLPTDRLVSGGLTMHTLSAEAYRYAILSEKLSVKWGLGLGVTIPNLKDGASETADNGHSWVLGAGANYKINPTMDIGTSIKGFFFTTDTHVTTYGSHLETLYSDGVQSGSVEVLDESHHNDRVNFNSVMLTFSLRWR